MKLLPSIINLVSAALLVAFCNYVVDVPLALLVKESFRKSPTWAKYVSDIPDTLFLVVCVTTLVSCAGYLVRVQKNVFDRATRCFLLIAFVVPLSYAGKSVLKFVFGRVNTRVWLSRPELYGFHWFHGSRLWEGFPSGHMAVFTALFAALWRYYPRSRPLCLFLSLLLAAALVVTNYHFLGDVVGGVYLGIFVEAGTYAALKRIMSCGVGEF